MEVKSIMKPFGSQSFLLGLGMAAAAYFLGPQLKELVKPVAVKSAQGAIILGGKTKQLINQGKEKVSDVMYEKAVSENNYSLVQVESAGAQEKLLMELKQERELSNKILEELKESISGLREEISRMKNSTEQIEQ